MLGSEREAQGKTKTLGKKGHPSSKPPCHFLLCIPNRGLWKPYLAQEASKIWGKQGGLQETTLSRIASLLPHSPSPSYLWKAPTPHPVLTPPSRDLVHCPLDYTPSFPLFGVRLLFPLPSLFSFDSGKP